MAEKRKIFRKKRFKRFDENLETSVERDVRLSSVVSTIVSRDALFKRFIDDSEDDSEDDFKGFDGCVESVKERLQKRWKQRIETLKQIKDPKPILRKARLEISTQTLQRIRDAHQPIGCRSGQPGSITCQICCQTKFYAHVQRRYGVFACEPCSKFFARFLRRPQQLFCLRDGRCSLRTTPSVRCRSCWLTTCFNTFRLDSQQKLISQTFQPKVKTLCVETHLETMDTTKRGPPLLMVATSGPRVKRVCRRAVSGLPVATFSPKRQNSSSDDSDDIPVDVYLCRAVAERTQVA